MCPVSYTHLSLCYDYQLIDTEEKRKEIIQKLLTSKILSLDTETTGTETMDAELVGIDVYKRQS